MRKAAHVLLQTGCGQSDQADAPKVMLSSLLQRSVVICRQDWGGGVCGGVDEGNWSAESGWALFFCRKVIVKFGAPYANRFSSDLFTSV